MAAVASPSALQVPHHRFAEILERLRQVRLVVVGDLMLDHYLWGDAHRLSPEAPVPVVLVDRDSWVPGGAANVAVNLAALGAQVELCGLTGDDEGGARLRQLLASHGIAYDAAVWVRPGVPTIVKSRVLVRNQQLCRLDRESRAVHYALSEADHRGPLATKLRGAHGLIVSDYAKGVVDTATYLALREASRAAGVPLAYDPKPRRGLAFHGPDLMTPNRKESLELAGLELGPHDPYPAAEVCRAIYRKHAPASLVVTLGADGMLLSIAGEVSHTIPTYAREVFDVSGAGDTAIAALAAAQAAGASLELAAHFANTAAGIVVAKVGTAIATPAEILAYHAGR